MQSYTDPAAFQPQENNFDSFIKVRQEERAIHIKGSAFPETIHNNYEVKIAPYQEVNKFTRRFILLLMSVQTVFMLVMVFVLYSRIAFLETEATRLSLLVTDTFAHSSLQVSEVREECRDLFSMDCSMYNDDNSPDFEEHELLLDVEIEDQHEQGDGVNGENAEQERFKRGLRKQEPSKRKNQPKGEKKKNVQRKRFRCQKCMEEGNTSSPGNKNRPRSSRVRSQPAFSSTDVAAVHLKGGLPEVLLQNKGTIGPWFYDRRTENTSNNSLDFKLEPNSSSVVVLTDGFYFIYAQVYYLSTGGTNSFSIVKQRDYSHREETLATCSSASLSNHGEEVSCFTATVGRLKRGDALHLSEREMNRRVLFRDGQTYFGLMRLSPPPSDHKPVTDPSSPNPSSPNSLILPPLRI